MKSITCLKTLHCSRFICFSVIDQHKGKGKGQGKGKILPRTGHEDLKWE